MQFFDPVSSLRHSSVSQICHRAHPRGLAVHRADSPEHIDEVYGQVAKSEYADDDDEHFGNVASGDNDGNSTGRRHHRV